MPAPAPPASAPRAPAAAPVDFGSTLNVTVGAQNAPKDVTCPTCNHKNQSTFRFCASCGTLLSPAAKPVAPAPVAAPRPAPPAPVAASASATLTALRPDGTDATSFPLPAGSTLVGRDLGGVFGGDSYMSPKHATFVVAPGRVTVRDENSLNGVYLRIQRDTPIELKPDSIFRIGQEIIRFEKLAPPPPSPDGVERLGSPAEGLLGRLSLIVGRDTTGNSFVIPSHGIHLGRERGDVLFAEDGYVSGLHCRITQENSKINLVDLNSSNGTYVRLNDERELRTGDILLMGQQLFRITF
jgi:pSer/pThr/pTyr-binding forkhead associated (FHA) protein